MTWQSALAIFTLFWVMSAFVVLPFNIRTHEEAGTERVPGQADSAPHDFRPGRVVKWTTIVAVVAFALFYANYVNGWVVAGDLDLFTPRAPGQ